MSLITLNKLKRFYNKLKIIWDSLDDRLEETETVVTDISERITNLEILSKDNMKRNYYNINDEYWLNPLNFTSASLTKDNESNGFSMLINNFFVGQSGYYLFNFSPINDELGGIMSFDIKCTVSGDICIGIENGGAKLYSINTEWQHIEFECNNNGTGIIYAQTSIPVGNTVYVRNMMKRPSFITDKTYIPPFASNKEMGITWIATSHNGNETRFDTEILCQFRLLCLIVRDTDYQALGSTIAAAPEIISNVRRMDCIPVIDSSGTTSDNYKGYLRVSGTTNNTVILGSGSSSYVILVGIKGSLEDLRIS